jgi:hypothetical protein
MKGCPRQQNPELFGDFAEKRFTIYQLILNRPHLNATSNGACNYVWSSESHSVRGEHSFMRSMHQSRHPGLACNVVVCFVSGM